MSETTTAPLTAEDIADIAGYLGSPCSYEVPAEFTGRWGTYGPIYMTSLELCTLELYPSRYRNFHLHLRDLRHLTEDDVRAMAGLCGLPESDRFWVDRDEDSGDINVEVPGVRLHITLAGGIWVRWIGNSGKMTNPAPAIRYAMRKGFYYPGSVREELVKLIE